MAKCLLLHGWLVLLKTSACCGLPIFLKVKPPTGEPGARNWPARFGGRGDPNRRPYPYHLPTESYAPSRVPCTSRRAAGPCERWLVVTRSRYERSRLNLVQESWEE